MHTEEKTVPVSPWLRLGGTLVGAILSAFGAAVLFFVIAVLNALPAGASFQLFLTAIAFPGAFFGFALPRQTIHSLWFFFPEVFD